MAVLIKIIQVILALSLLVIVHEFGHFIFARIFKIRVEKFYLFFPPAIIKFKPKNSDTEFGIGSIPVGGFCKISGMIDESMDKEQMKRDPEPWEFRTRPAWQRLLVMSGGVLMNMILAVVIYIGVLFTWGEEYLKTENAIYGVEVNELSEEIGFRSGDKLLAFDGEAVPENFAELQVYLVRNRVGSVTLLRGDDTVEVKIDPLYIPAMLNTPGMFTLRAPIAVGGFPDSSINASSGMVPGDKFVKVGEKDVRFYRELQDALKPLAGGETVLTFSREGELVALPAKVDSSGKLEIFLSGDISEFDITRKEYSFFSAIPAGVRQVGEMIGNYVRELGLIFSPETEAYKSVGSFIAIGSVFPSQWNWQIFWNITALLSIMLAVMNLLPIPALDGGHIVFTIYEMITGKKPSDKFMMAAQSIGMLFLLVLMVFAFGNDIMRLLR